MDPWFFLLTFIIQTDLSTDKQIIGFIIQIRRNSSSKIRMGPDSRCKEIKSYVILQCFGSVSVLIRFNGSGQLIINTLFTKRIRGSGFESKLNGSETLILIREIMGYEKKSIYREINQEKNANLMKKIKNIRCYPKFVNIYWFYNWHRTRQVFFFF